MDCDNVEAGRPLFGVSLQVVVGGHQQACLLGRADSLLGAPEAGVATVADLYEHHAVVILHYQIDLSATAAVISCQQFQPGSGQVRTGNLFGSGTIEVDGIPGNHGVETVQCDAGPVRGLAMANCCRGV